MNVTRVNRKGPAGGQCTGRRRAWSCTHDSQMHTRAYSISSSLTRAPPSKCATFPLLQLAATHARAHTHTHAVWRCAPGWSAQPGASWPAPELPPTCMQHHDRHHPLPNCPACTRANSTTARAPAPPRKPSHPHPHAPHSLCWHLHLQNATCACVGATRHPHNTLSSSSTAHSTLTGYHLIPTHARRVTSRRPHTARPTAADQHLPQLPQPLQAGAPEGARQPWGAALQRHVGGARAAPSAAPSYSPVQDKACYSQLQPQVDGRVPPVERRVELLRGLQRQRAVVMDALEAPELLLVLGPRPACVCVRVGGGRCGASPGGATRKARQQAAGGGRRHGWEVVKWNARGGREGGGGGRKKGEGIGKLSTWPSTHARTRACPPSPSPAAPRGDAAPWATHLPARTGTGTALHAHTHTHPPLPPFGPPPTADALKLVEELVAVPLLHLGAPPRCGGLFSRGRVEGGLQPGEKAWRARLRTPRRKTVLAFAKPARFVRCHALSVQCALMPFANPDASHSGMR